MPTNTPPEDLLRLTGQIVVAHLAHNAVPTDAVPGVIRAVYGALKGAGAPAKADTAPVPAVPVRKSVFPDYIICLEDGKQMKTLKRHLKTSFNMTPQQYRERWGLPSDYPMTAPSYTARRSDMAKKLGLGRKSSNAPAEVAVRRIPEGMSARKAQRHQRG